MIVLLTDPAKSDVELSRIVCSVVSAVPAGKLAVIVRDKSRDDVDVLPLAQELRTVTRDAGQLLLVHRDHLRLAYEVGADGVHDPTPNLDARLHKEGAPTAIVSVPAHSDADIVHAATHGADWILVSPIFATPGKGTPRGLDAIRSAAGLAATWGPKVLALGGVDASNAADCMRAGADGVAVIRSILRAEDPAAAVRSLWNAIAPLLEARP